MTQTSPLSEIAAWLDANVLLSTVLAALGAAMLVGILTTLSVLALRLVGRMLSKSNVSNRSVRRAALEPGYRILIGEFDGSKAGIAARLVTDALEAHLSRFLFGAAISTFRVKSETGRPEGEVLRLARRKLDKSGADLLLWGVRFGDDADGLRLCGVSRGGAVTADQAAPFTIDLPGKLKRFDETVETVAAYLIAKRLQPALGRPDAFRQEKIEGIGAILDDLLDKVETGAPELSRATKLELETDFAAIALFLSEAGMRPEWLDKLITRRRATLEALKAAPDREAQIAARLDLGRALIRRAEQNFDPVAVREASVHLNAAIESLRQHGVIRKAQSASEALQKAQSLVETRRRFAVNFSA